MSSQSPFALPSAALDARAARAWQAMLEAEPERAPELCALLSDADFSRQLGLVLACSDYVAGVLRREPALLLELAGSGFLSSTLDDDAWRQELGDSLDARPGELERCLRRFRNRHMVRIVWRDFCRLADTLETTRDVSLLAEACICSALDAVREPLESRFGIPTGRESGDRQALIVLAMGKLGARELNVSSDIDLIFAWPEPGETIGGARTLSNEEFFTRLGRALIAALDAVTADGFVFRVDMRLRPYGDSGPLVQSFPALERYYQEQGRDWERYALVKARSLTGERRWRVQLRRMLQPFVYRRYVDFSVIESLRAMKSMISTEVRRRGLEENIKLGPGGIREIEFIAQCFQLIRGGRDRDLRQRGLLPVLEACVSLGCLPATAADELRAAYLFLRDTEHAMQGFADRQTQDLPKSAEERSALAWVMGFADFEAFQRCLDEHRGRVAHHFSRLIEPPRDGVAGKAERAFNWDSDCEPERLKTAGFQRSDHWHSQLLALRDSRRVAGLEATGRERLDHFMPALLSACAGVPDPDLALERTLPFLEAVVRRSAYLVLLLENPEALRELVALCHLSPWIAEQLAHSPVLLEELLDPAQLYRAEDREGLRTELRQQISRLPLSDLEAHMEALRYFKAATVLRVAASEQTGNLPLMKVSDKLTFIAEVCLEHALVLAWDALVSRHGRPGRPGDGTGFAIFGYGKLGGLELGYGSDLDLVFLFDAEPGVTTEGPRSLDNIVFYTRLGQKIIHILQTRTPLGQLYEVDMRLRPSGQSGLLVSSLPSFAAYQRERAWTWEHQALVRARFVAGDIDLAARVDALRCEVLCQPRPLDALARDVVSMRRRMRDHLLPAALAQEQLFDLKQSPGGIVDIEFMVQYLVLAHASGDRSLATWSDNIRILEDLQRAGVLAPASAEILREAYLELRALSHRLALQQQPARVPEGQVEALSRAVREAWQNLFAEVEDAMTSSETREP